MRNRTWSRWIPLVKAVPPNRFRFSDELLASAGPFWSDQDDLLEFLAQVVTCSDMPAQSLFVGVSEAIERTFAVKLLGSEWHRSVLEAKLWSIRIPTALVEQAKRERLLQWFDCTKMADELYRLASDRLGAPDTLVDRVRSSSNQPPSISTWDELEKAAMALVGGGWLSPDEIRGAVRSSRNAPEKQG